MRASHRYIPTHERLIVSILLLNFGEFVHKDESKKNAFLVSRIGMALRPLRPKDTANIKKKSNFPNNSL